jgi:hypothetical protein
MSLIDKIVSSNKKENAINKRVGDYSYDHMMQLLKQRRIRRKHPENPNQLYMGSHHY